MADVRNRNEFVGIISDFLSESLYGLSYIFTKQATQAASVFALLG